MFKGSGRDEGWAAGSASGDHLNATQVHLW